MRLGGAAEKNFAGPLRPNYVHGVPTPESTARADCAQQTLPGGIGVTKEEWQNAYLPKLRSLTQTEDNNDPYDIQHARCGVLYPPYCTALG